MSQQINDSFQNNSPKPLNSWYHKGFSAGVSIPYDSVDEVNTIIPQSYRSKGLTVLINVRGDHTEYWYKDGITNADLMEKEPRLAPGNNVSITRTGNIYTISANVQVSDSSTMESFTATGDFSKTFLSGTIITSFILDPPDNNSYIISVGTTPGGTDVFYPTTVDGSNPPSFEYLKYFKNSQTWYFNGVPSGTFVIIMYRPQIVLV